LKYLLECGLRISNNTLHINSFVDKYVKYVKKMNFYYSEIFVDYLEKSAL